MAIVLCFLDILVTNKEQCKKYAMNSVVLENVGKDYKKARGNPYHTIARIDAFHGPC